MGPDPTLDAPLGRIPAQLGPYRLGRKLGEGATGAVFAATLTADRPFGARGTQVAIKLLHPAVQRDARVLARFLREGRAGARVSHPSVVQTHEADAVTVDGFLHSYLVQELVEGMSLRELLGELRTLPEALLCVIAGDVARALAAIHGSGLVHRDLKPSNILLTRDQRAKIADLGVATLLDEAGALTAPGDFVGTPLYAAPEQFAGQGVGPASDLYALGVVLYECATGYQPFAADSAAAVMGRHLQHTPEPVTARNPRLSSFFERILATLLAKTPAERFPSAADLALTLEQGEASAWWRAGPAPAPAQAAIALAAPPLAARTPGAASRRAGNLPRELTSFVGRAQELVQLADLVAETPLVTLTGAGGCGKTRLALRLGAMLERRHADGVWLVELAPIADGRLVAGAVAGTLGISELPGQAIEETLARHLESKDALLLLDNCEHLLEATAALVTGLLRSSHRLRVLATSREPLGVPGERPFVLLSLPEAEAEALFLERARGAVPGYQPSAADTGALPEVCRRLDGMPLAIELAAARVRTLSVEQIAARLDDRFRLLTAGSRASLPRQRSLRATIDWSYEHLTGDEQRLLCRIAVFAGGFTLEAAERVAGGDGIEPPAVLELMTRLIDKSLVTIPARAPEARFGLLETVRVYARERLGESGEAAAIADRHLDWCLELAERCREEQHGPGQVAALARLDREHENLRAALAWSLTAEHGAERGLRLAGSLGVFWQRRGHIAAARRWLESVLTRPGAEARTRDRALALAAAAVPVMRQGDWAEATSLGEEALSIYRELDDRSGIATALNGLGVIARRRGDLALARARYQDALALRREIGPPTLLILTMNNLAGTLHRLGEHAAARRLLEESLTIGRAIGASQSIAAALNSLGSIAIATADASQARPLFEEALRIAQEIGDRDLMANAQGNIASLLWAAGETARARQIFEEELEFYRAQGHREHTISALLGLGQVAWSDGDVALAHARYAEGLRLACALGSAYWGSGFLLGLACLDAQGGRARRGARLLGAMERLCRSAGVWFGSGANPQIDVVLAATRAALGEQAAAELRAEGQGLTLDQAAELALAPGDD